jgi:hypothetical protein
MDKDKVVLAEFDTQEEAEAWRSKLKTSEETNKLIQLTGYPIWDYGEDRWLKKPKKLRK